MVSCRRGRGAGVRGGQPRLGGGRGSPGVEGVGSSVPAASQPRRRALQRQKRKLAVPGRNQGGCRGPRSPCRLARAKRGPLDAGMLGYLAAPAGHLPARFPRGAATEASAGGGEPSPWCPIQTVPARGGEEGAQRPTSGGLDPSALGAAAFVGLAALRDGAGRGAPSWSLEGRLIHAP